MKKSSETVLGQIGLKVLAVLKMLLRGVGYVIYGLGEGVRWLGLQLRRLSGEKVTEKRAVQPVRREAPPVKQEQAQPTERPVQAPTIEPEKPEIDVPTSKAEILAVIESAPFQVFPKDERRLIESVLTLRERPVKDLMIPKDKIVYVSSNELLGPLVLDRLYQSKMLHFPVKNPKGEVIGAIHTGALNSLEVKESFRAGEILDPEVYYLREDYTMAEALDTFLRNDCYFCLVVNNYGKIVGMVNFDDLAEAIFGTLRIDDFKRDTDPLAVAKRRFPIEAE